jgi:hypothetical protein
MRGWSWGSNVRGLEYFVLDSDDHVELIVNITEVDDTEVVNTELGRDWTWNAYQVTTVPAEEGEGPTEWMTLTGAKRRVQQAAA